MEHTLRAKALDRFKLIVTIILIIIIIILLLQFPGRNGTPIADNSSNSGDTSSSSNGSGDQDSTTDAPEASDDSTEIPDDDLNLPPFPEPSDGLTFNEDTENLDYTDKLPRYRLNDDRSGWIPIVPEDVQDELPIPAIPEKDDNGDWVLNGENDDLVYKWDFNSHSWQPVAPPDTGGSGDSGSQAVIEDCPGAMPAHLEIGDKVRVTTNLNFRSSPGILEDNWMLTHIYRTVLTVVDGSVCTQYDYGSYRWWQVETADGRVGWSAEGSATGAFYFLEPFE